MTAPHLYRIPPLTSRFPSPLAGKWENGGPTGIPMIYANLMKDGTVIGWATTFAGPIGGSGRNDQYGTVVRGLRCLAFTSLRCNVSMQQRGRSNSR